LSEAPLKGIRVVECGSLIAGPVCARLLGDYGADVVKVEDPGAGDLGRVWGDHKLDGRSLWWPIQGRNKRCVTINLRTEAGQELLKRLLETADVFVENFRPGTLERWGIGPDVLAELNPRLIVVRVSGFGQTGPGRNKAGFGVVGEAIGGLRNVTGYPDQAPPRVGISLGDQLASIFGVVGALLALHARERTGRGQVVDVAIYEAVFMLMESLVTEHAKLGVLRQRMGPRLAGAAPSSIYPTSDGEWIIVAGNADNVFRRLAEAMGRPELADDPRYVSHISRVANADELDETISEWTRELTAEAVEVALEAAGVPCCKIYSEADIVADQHFWAREMLLRLQDGDLGELVIPGVVPKLSATPGSVRWLAPGLGEHNRDVFVGDLGLSEDELASLHADGTV
jgi:crotonobetainyl-CoA:carnitine CoA-transferase CaiB-like acyl-CoA transferase